MTTATQEAAMTSDQAAPGVWRLGSDFINYYAIEEDGRLTLIDAGAPRFADTLEPQLAAAGFALEDIEAVVLTHSDGDHTGVVPLLQRAGARILIHEQDEATLRKPGPKTGDAAPLNLVKQLWRPRLVRMLVMMTRAGAAKPTPVEGAETYADAQLLDVPGSPRVIHTPGHNPGQCAIHFEQRGVLFAGDALCSLNMLTGSRGPQLMPQVFNVSNAAARASLAKLEAVEAGVVLFGHGEPWTQGAAAAVAAARERLD